MSTSAPQVPSTELSWRFSRSSGPGGQHVNTADTKVELRWDIATSSALDDLQRERIRQQLSARMVGDELVVRSSRFRSQARNRVEAVQRLHELLEAALRTEPRRRPTRPTRASRRRQERAKRQRSQIKSDRRGSWT